MAHEILFKHRHTDTTPPFHRELIDLWHSQIPHVSAMAFREGGKSTIAEEALALCCEFQLFRNGIIVGATERRAVERLRAIKYEIETNEFLLELFGAQGGSAAEVWNDSEIILANGIRLTAIGRGQSLRGTKHLHYRPDFAFCDDIEEVEEGKIYTAEDAQETMRWFMKVFLPALDKKARVRLNATPLSPEALPLLLARDPDWVSKKYPIEYLDEHGDRVPMWPSRYPLEWIDAKRESFARVGMLHDYMQEYMCEAEDPATKVFTSAMFKVNPRVRTWQPTFAFYDPARTVKATSATTGWAVWSWIANRLVVWDAGAGLWKPDEILAHIFELHGSYQPTEIGVEEVGLNEFIMQPLRHEMIRRATLVPIRPYNAPKGKIKFIEGLQPFFNAKEIELAKPLPELVAQFLSFPTGRIDIPNALAYALKMRPGQIVYEDFTSSHVFEELMVFSHAPLYLAVNASGSVTTAIAVQYGHGIMRVFRDWVREGDPGSVLADITREAGLSLGGKLTLVSPPRHFDQYDSIGLRGAVAKIPAKLTRGGSESLGREELRALMKTQRRDMPSLQVCTAARWTLNAFAAGYVREIGKDGRVKDVAKTGPYQILMEGLEAFASLLKAGMMDEDRGTLNVRHTPNGQAYISALPGQRSTTDAKDSWGSNLPVLSARR